MAEAPVTAGSAGRGGAWGRPARLAAALVLLGGAAAASEAPPAPDWIAALAGRAAEGRGAPAGPWALSLPADHAPHPEAASEVWQLAAHLTDDDGAPVGVQLLLFRLALGPAEADPAPFAAQELWRGHAILFDGATGDSRAEERFGRGMAGLVGFDAAGGELRLDHWSLAFGDGAAGPWRLSAAAEGARADLVLTPVRPAVAAAAEGAPFRGYALSRLAVTGEIAAAAGTRRLTGTAWFDHLWGELPLPGGAPVVSDRLLLQLDDGSDVTLVRSRRADGRGTATLEAVVVGPDGRARVLAEGVAEADPVSDWPGAAAVWPVAWSLRLDDLELAVTPVAEGQEHRFVMPVWSGLVEAAGRRGDRPVRGLGTLQLSGEGR